MSMPSAQAQVVERPERAIRGLFGSGPPPDPNRPTNDLVLSLDTFGGYAEDLTQAGTGSIGAFTPRPPSYNAYAGSMLNYRRTSGANRVEMGGGAYMNSYRNVGRPPGYGGDAHVRFGTRLGERHGLDLAGHARSDPFYQLSTFGPLEGISAPGILPEAGSPEGFSMRRSEYLTSSASINSEWSRRGTTNASIQYGYRDFHDNVGDGGTASASFSYTHQVSRRASLVGSYMYTDSAFLTSQAVNSPRTTHNLNLGYRYHHPFSPTRALSIGFGAGAIDVRTTSGATPSAFQYVTPSAYANVRLEVARSWSIRADYRREVSVLEGLTPEPFNAGAAMVHVGGLIHRRMELVISGGYSNGRAGVAPQGHYSSYVGGSQLRWSVTRRWSAVVGHTYYAYQLHDVAQLPPGLQTRMNRQTLRVGMALAVPLYGTFNRTAGTTERN